MVILGIDPGTTRIGFGAVTGGKKAAFVDCGLLTITAKKSEERVAEAARHFETLLKKYRPEVVAVEKLFFVNNQKTGLRVAEMRGVIMMLAHRSNAVLKEYAPTEIKKAVAGFGGADKQAVAKMVCLTLSLQNIPGPDDVSDALAVALTASFDLSATIRSLA
jgi:crossover junction endodeoxyribonuclease RuvC